MKNKNTTDKDIMIAILETAEIEVTLTDDGFALDSGIEFTFDEEGNLLEVVK